LVERVAAGDVAQFEAQQRNLGSSGFEVFELSTAGSRAAVSGRDAYYPVVYDFRGAGAGPSSLLGFDLSSFAAGRDLLDGDTMRASPPLSAPQADLLGNEILFALALPSAGERPNRASRGIVVRPLSAKDFLDPQRGRPIAQISDITDSAQPLPLYGKAAFASSLGEDIEVGNRTWRIAILNPPASAILLAPATVLALGLLLTSLFLTASETSGSRARARDLQLQIDRQTSDLRHSEDVYRSLFDNAGTANCETDPLTGHILKVNDRMCELFGYSRDELLKMSLIDVTHPNDRQASIDMLAAIAAGGHDTLTVDKRYLRKDGSAFWALKTTRLINDGEGQPTVCTTVIQDISQRKADEQAKARLLRELAHRVRNTVQLMASLADQTAKSATSVESYRRNFQNRLRALKTAQDLLFEAEWRKVGLVELATSTLAPFQNGDHAAAISVQLPAIDLPTQHAQTLAIAFHELASNAIQYGALSRPAGRIYLTGSLEKGSPDDAGEGVLVMKWKERAGPAVTKPQRRGFGRVMLERVLATQFGGSTELRWEPEGIEFKARLPLTDLDSETTTSDALG
jgi:PAS domain S-box-containing protein